MTQAVILILAFGGAGALLALFTRWERVGKEHYVVFLIVALIVAETTLYQNQDNMPRDIFHPGSGAFEFRLPEILITLALLARLMVKGKPRWIGLPSLLWMAFAAWYFIALIEGLLHHNDTTQIPYEAKAIIYVVGGYAVAAGVPAQRYLEGRGLERLVRWSGVAAAVIVGLSLVHKQFSVHIPLLPLPDFGVDGSDAATVYAAIGIIGLLMELAKPKRSTRTLLAVVPLLVSPFLTGQRAVLVMLGASVAVILVVALGPTARRRLRVTSGQVLLCFMAVVGVVLAVSVVPAAEGQGPVSLPFSSTLSQTFQSTAKIESEADRANKWQVSWGYIRQHPIMGSGLGFEFTYWNAGPNVFVTTDINENIALDLLLRAGLIGLILFFLPLFISIGEGLAAWRHHPDRMAAVLALALVAVVVGFVSKGMVESIFEKYRLATMLGISLGLLRSIVTSAHRNWRERGRTYVYGEV
jgi:O-antigen ligase